MTCLLQYSTDVQEAQPVGQHPYHAPETKRQLIAKEEQKMLPAISQPLEQSSSIA